MSQLTGKHVLLLVGPDYEDLELWYPKLRVEEAGGKTTTAGLAADALYHGKNGQPCTANESVHDIGADEFDALVIPGGWMPRRYAKEDGVVALVRSFAELDKPIAASSHGPTLLVAARVVKGRTLTSTPGIQEDLTYAGARWVDQPVVVDGKLVTIRHAGNLPDLTRELLTLLAG